MKAKINTKELKTALALHKKIIDKKQGGTFILGGVKLKANWNNQSIEVISTNLGQSLKTELEGTEVTTGGVVLPFDVFSNTIKCCEDKFVEIKTTEGLQCKVDKMLINGMDLEEFPEFPKVEDENKQALENLDFGDFCNSISKIIKTVSVDEDRGALTGICLDTKNNKIIGTNSYTLGVKNFQFNGNVEQFVIPGKCLTIFKDILKTDKTERFNLSMMESQTQFTIGKHTLVTRNLTGKYPEYEKLISTDFDYVYQIETSKLIKILDKSNKIFKKGKKWEGVTPVNLHFKKQRLEVTKTVKEIGIYKDEMQIEATKQGQIITYEVEKEGKIFGPFKTLEDAQGYITENFHSPKNIHVKEIVSEELEIAFNPYLLKDVLENFETVDLHLKDPLRPMIVNNDDDLKYIIMPIRI